MIQRLKPKSEFSRNVLTLMTGTTIAQAIPIAISPILTRIYTPEDFGVFALYMAIVSIVAVMATGRYELAIMLPKKDEDAFNIVALSVFIAITISLITLIIIFLLNEQITQLIGNPEVSNWLYMMPLSIFITGLYQSLNHWNSRKKQFKTLSTNRVLHSGSVASFQLGMGCSGLGASGLIAGGVLGQSLATANLVNKIRKEDKQFFSSLKNIKQLALFKRYKNFPKFDVPSAVLNVGAAQIPNVLFSVLYAPMFAGYFYLTQRVLQAPITLVSSSILDVFKQRATYDYQKLGNARIIYQKTFLTLILIGLPPTLLLFFFIQDLFTFIFGEEWRVSGEYAQIMLPALFLRFIANPLSFMFYITEKQHWNLVCMVFLFLGVVSSFFVFNSAYEVVIGVSCTYVAYYILHLVLSCKLAGF